MKKDILVKKNWKWNGISLLKNNDSSSRYLHQFDTPCGKFTVLPKVTVMSLGGGSWKRLGSDGAWVSKLRPHLGKNDILPFRPANMGFKVVWSDYMKPFFGSPVKNVVLHIGNKMSKGEFVIVENGVEGGAIYDVSRNFTARNRDLTIDLLPNVTHDQIKRKMLQFSRKTTLTNNFRKNLRLSGVKLALLRDRYFPLSDHLDGFEQKIKHFKLKLEKTVDFFCLNQAETATLVK